MPKPEQLAYIAGILDGEGCIGVYKNNGQHTLVVAVKMCDPEAIGEIYEHFGGSNSGYDGVNGFVYRVSLVGKKAYALLKAVRPYLRVKAEQADWAMEFHEECFSLRRRILTPDDYEKRNMYEAQLKYLKTAAVLYS